MRFAFLLVTLTVLSTGVVHAQEDVHAHETHAQEDVHANEAQAQSQEDAQAQAHSQQQAHPGDSSRGHVHEHAGRQSTDGAHEHTEPSFHGHRLEVGLSPGLAYIVGEQDLTLGLHMHLVARLGETRWGLGVGLERLFDEHGHTTASAVLQVRLIAGWSAILAVGATFEDGEGFTPRPSVHVETTYEFEIGAFHIGPSLELALDPEDVHVTLGMHLGFGVD